MNRDPNDSVSVLSHILDATIAMVMLMSMAVLLMAASSDSDASSGVTFGDFDEQESTVVATISRDATGDVVVPATITSGGKVYDVIGIHTESTPVLNGMTSLYVPESVSTIHTRLFHWDSPLLTSITVDPDNQVYSSDGGILFSKDGTELISCPISLNGGSYTVPNGVREIGNYAFKGCGDLESIILPEGLVSIGYSAFDGCVSLTSIAIPDSVTSIGDMAFEMCTSLVAIGADGACFKAIDGVLFDETSDTLIRYPMAKTGVDYDVPDGYHNIGTYAFSDCVLESIDLTGIRTIGPSSFIDCTELTDVTFSDSLVTVESYAFFGCTDLTSVTVPDSVNELGSYAFSKSGLTTVVLGDGIERLSRTFDGCVSLADVTLSEGLLTLGEGVFRNCESLTYVHVPSSVTDIGSAVFEGCAVLQSVSIPAKIDKIRSDTFEGCTSLVIVGLNNYADRLDIDKFAFGDCHDDISFKSDRQDYILTVYTATGTELKGTALKGFNQNGDAVLEWQATSSGGGVPPEQDSDPEDSDGVGTVITVAVIAVAAVIGLGIFIFLRRKV